MAIKETTPKNVKLVTPKKSVELGKDWAGKIGKIFTPQNISADDVAATVEGLKTLYDLYNANIKDSSVTGLVFVGERDGVEYNWTVKWSDLHDLINYIKTLHESKAKGENLITRPDLPNGRGKANVAAPAELPVVDVAGLYE